MQEINHFIINNIKKNRIMKTLQENQMATIQGNGCFFAIPKALLLCGVPYSVACINAQIEVAICWNDTE